MRNAPGTGMPRVSCSRRRMARSDSTGRLPITSTSIAATSAPPKRCSATSCSTSSCRATTTRRPACASSASTMRAAVAFSCSMPLDPKPRMPRPLRCPGLKALSEVARATGPYAARSSARLARRGLRIPTRRPPPPLARAVWPSRRSAGTCCAGHIWSTAAQRPRREGFSRRRGRSASCVSASAPSGSLSPSLASRVAALGDAIVATQAAIGTAAAELHQHEKAIVGFEAQLARAAEDATRLSRRAEQLALERRRAEDEGVQLDVRQAEARESIARIELEQRDADARLNTAQRRLFAARETVERISHRVSEAKAASARLTERASALQADVQRLEDAARELDARVIQLRAERDEKNQKRAGLLEAIADGVRALDADIRVARGAARHRSRRRGDRHRSACRRRCPGGGNPGGACAPRGSPLGCGASRDRTGHCGERSGAPRRAGG